MKESNKYTDKQYDYIISLASEAYPLKGHDFNTPNVDEKHIQAFESFKEDVKNEVLRLVKKNIDEKPTKSMASMIIEMLKKHENGFLAEVAPKNFAEIVDKNNQHGTFGDKTNQVSVWYKTGWEKHSKTYEIIEGAI